VWRWLLLVLAGCPRHTGGVVETTVVPPEGTAISIFVGSAPGSAIAVIDDRRKITVAGNAFTLDRIDPAAQLPALVIESLDPHPDHQPFRIGTCVRERADSSAPGLDRLAVPRPPQKPLQPRASLPVPPVGVLSPFVRCTVAAAPGTYHVRVLQVTALPAFQTFHQVSITGEQAKIATRFAITTLPWAKQRASLIVFDGLPGNAIAPRASARSEVVLDGAVALLANPPTTARAHLRRIYDGALRDPATLPTTPSWGKGSSTRVTTNVDLEGVDLTTGQVDVHLELAGEAPRDLLVLPTERERRGTTQRLDLGPIATLRGSRKTSVETLGKVIKQQLALSVTNTGDTPQSVSIEETLRPELARTIAGLSATAKVVGDLVRVDVVVPPKGTEQITFTVTYTR